MIVFNSKLLASLQSVAITRRICHTWFFCQLLKTCCLYVNGQGFVEDSLIRPRRSLSTAEAKLVLDAHNEHRATIGDEGEEPIPANMKFMTWDDGLAVNSLEYSKKCVFEHSELGARRTPQLNKDNGENLWALSGLLASDFDPLRAVSVWFNEYAYYEFYNDSCEPGKKCGHYTQLVWANSHKLGCGWTVCRRLLAYGTYLDNALYMVCQYAPGGNVLGEQLYKVGDRCSLCDEGDTCPNGTLCHNEARDKIIPLESKADATAGIVVGVVLFLVAAGGCVYLIYIHDLQSTFRAAAWRRRRRVSSAANLKDEEYSSENNNEGKVGKKMTMSESRGARIASITLDTANSPD